MKIFLTWYADPPDPPYWVWIKDLDGVLVSLQSLRGCAIDRFGLRGLRGYLSGNASVMVDSLTTSLARYPPKELEPLQSWVLYVQRMLGADILIHRDTPLVRVRENRELREKLLKRTILNAEHALKLSERLGIDVMLVAQGWDLESYTRCAEKYAELGAKYVGVGSLVPRRSDPRYVEEVVAAVRLVVGGKTHVHAFGVMSPRSGARLAKYVDSVDISTPMRAAIARQMVVTDSVGRLRRVHLSTVTEAFVYEMLRSFSEELAEKAVRARTAREMVRYLAVYNAYTVIKWLRGCGEWVKGSSQ